MTMFVRCPAALLAQVRELMAAGKGPGNFLGTLDDAALHGVYNLVRQGSTSRAIARWLHEKGITPDQRKYRFHIDEDDHPGAIQPLAPNFNFGPG